MRAHSPPPQALDLRFMNPKHPSGCELIVLFSQKVCVLRDRDVNPITNPQPGGPVCLPLERHS